MTLRTSETRKRKRRNWGWALPLLHRFVGGAFLADLWISSCPRACAMGLALCPGFLHGSVGKESACSAGDAGEEGFGPWVGKIPWSRKWQPAQVFLPRKSRGQRSLAGRSPQGCRVGHDWARTALHPVVWCTFSLHPQNRLVRLTELQSLFQRQGNWVSERASHFLRPHNWPGVVSIKKREKKMWITGFHPSNSGLLLNSLYPL